MVIVKDEYASFEVAFQCLVGIVYEHRRNVGLRMTPAQTVTFRNCNQESVNALRNCLFNPLLRKLFGRAQENHVPVVTFGKEPE